MPSKNLVPTLPSRLAELRGRRGLSQQQLAVAAGTSLFSVSKLERGERSPSFELVCRLADALGVPVGALREPAGSPVPALPKKSKKTSNQP